MLSNGALRQPVTIRGAQTAFTVCGLTPGMEYTAVLSNLPEYMPIKWEVSFTGSAIYTQMPEPANVFRFTASKQCEEIAVRTELGDEAQAYLSIVPTNIKNDIQPDASVLEISPASNLTDLVKNTMFGNACGEISNISFQGNFSALGAFSNGQSNIGLNNGLVLSTGNAAIWQGPNTQSNASGGFGSVFGIDPNLALIAGTQQFDLAVLEFDIIPSSNDLAFQFVFGSEEYCEYVGTNFSDAFGIFVSGPGITGVQNIALVPGSNTPVTVNNINHVANPDYFVNNNIFDPQCQNLPPVAPNECQLDGWTKVLVAHQPVSPCSTYHIKIAIADIGDGAWDSAVFLQGGSGNNPKSVKAGVEYPNNQTASNEGCQGTVRIIRLGSNTSAPLPVHFTVSGSAIPGIDYTPLSSPVIIPAGQTEVLVPVNIFSDTLTEGPETIELHVDNSCVCGQTLEFSIADTDPLQVINPDRTECQFAELYPTVSGGTPPYTYLWSTGSKQDGVLILGPIGVSTAYTVTVTEGCGNTQSATALVTLNPPSPTLLQVQFCAGDSVQVFGHWFSDTGSFMYQAPGQNGQCDTSMTVIAQKVQTITRQMTIPLCPGEAFVANGNTYFAPASFSLLEPGASGACDTMTTYSLTVAPAVTQDKTISFCAGSSVVIDGTTYSNPGVVQSTIPGAGGACDTVINYTLKVLPKTLLSQVVELCPGEQYEQGGQFYTAPGSVTFIAAGQNGACDTVITTILKLLPPAAADISLQCPAAQTVSVEAGDPLSAVMFDAPVASGNCPCQGVTVEQTGGLPSGSVFPLGKTTNCYRAQDICGNTTACCVEIIVKEKPACDAKTSGCLKWEILSVKQDAEFRTTYKIRITNNCASKLVSADFQLPKGLIAEMPADNSTYTTPGGRLYTVANPNFSPFYSIRFSAQQAGISGGASDIFEYTLQPQAQMNYILAFVRLSPSIYYAAHLTAFNCLGTQLTQNAGDRGIPTVAPGILLYPNPTDGMLFVEVPATPADAPLPLRIFDAKGACVLNTSITGGGGPRALPLPGDLKNGIYLMNITMPDGRSEVQRFVVEQ